MGKLLRHRQTKGPVSARLYLNCRATPRLHLVDPLVSEAGTPSGLRRERSLRAHDGVVNVVGNPNPVISGFPKPSPIRWFERVSAATSFYAAFRPLFQQIGRWCTGIPLGHPSSAFIVVRHLLLAGKRRRARSPSWLAPRKRRPSRNRNCVHAKANRVQIG